MPISAAGAEPLNRETAAEKNITALAQVVLPAQGEDHDSETSNTKLYVLLGIYCLLIVAASLTGGWLPSLIHLTHTRIQILMSLVGGLMLGIGVFHMFPHALIELGPHQIDRAAWWMMCGLVVMFFLLRTFHFHQHDHGTPDNCGHDHCHDHDHGDGGPAVLPIMTEKSKSAGWQSSSADVHHLSWLGVFTGLAIHTLIDGMALGASMRSEAHHLTGNWLIGLGTFLAILLHKPLDAVSITSLMAAGRWSRSARTVVNATFSLMCPIGAVLFVIGIDRLSIAESHVIGCALAFSAGVFLCIALSDLLPEMEFHSHNRLQLSAALLLGLAIAYGIRYLEPEHVHHHAHAGFGEVVEVGITN
ncbi:MAG: ZIP family metal transporter [Planctomycetaceae bacterium]